MIYDDGRSFPSHGPLLLRLGSIFWLTLSGVPAHNARQAVVRSPIVGEELDHSVGRVLYRSGTRSSPTKSREKEKK